MKTYIRRQRHKHYKHQDMEHKGREEVVLSRLRIGHTQMTHLFYLNEKINFNVLDVTHN